MSALTCPSCGKQLAEYTRFCPECGARLLEPQAAPPAPPPGGLRTVILPPAEAAADAPPPEGAAAPPPAADPASIPPTLRLDAPAQSGNVPLGTLPPAPEAHRAGEAAPAAPGGRRTLWWVLGGVGCLSVLVLGACLTFGAFTLIGQRVIEGVEVVEGPATGVEEVEPGVELPAVGAVLLEDDFSDPGVSNLDESEDATSRSAYEDGGYVLEVKEPETLVWVLVGGPYSEIGAEVAAEVASGSDIAAAGLVFHYQDDDNFYLFSVTNDGYYALEVLQDGEWIVLIDPTLSDEVGPGSNTLRVETSGGRIALYVNGALLEETIDETFTSGEVALAVSTFADSTGTVRFDDLVIRGSE